LIHFYKRIKAIEQSEDREKLRQGNSLIVNKRYLH